MALHIYGDSKIIIDNVIGKFSIKNQLLTGWMNIIDFFLKGKNDYSIQHVDRSQNVQADSLSKKGLLLQPGKWKMDILLGNITYHIDDFSLIGT